MIIAHIRSSFADAFFPRLSEWYSASILFALGWMLSGNSDLMMTSTSNAYGLMLMIADQGTWAVILKLFAAARLTVLLVNGAWRRSPHLRAITAFLSCFFWTQIALSFAPIFGFAFIFSAGALMLDCVNIVRAARDARTVDHAYSKGGTAGDHG